MEPRSFFDSLEDFFDEGDFDVVYVASPNSLHYEQVRLAIENDKFVIVEKPAFVNPNEFEGIESLLAAHPKARVVEAARHIHTGLFHAAEEQLKQMPVIQGANITVMKYSSRYDKVVAGDKPYPNIFTAEFAGGALMDLGVYAVYGAVTLFGVPDSVVLFPTMVASGVDGMDTAILKYDKFAVTLNFGNDGPTRIWFLKCTVLRIRWSLTQSLTRPKVTYYDSEKQAHPLEAKFYENSMVDELNDFADLFNDPENPEQQAKYRRWFDLARKVNTVMYDLRRSAELTFPADDNR